MHALALASLLSLSPAEASAQAAVAVEIELLKLRQPKAVERGRTSSAVPFAPGRSGIPATIVRDAAGNYPPLRSAWPYGMEPRIPINALGVVPSGIIKAC